jgi:phenylacetic acid degradation operon negative regulatory protein
MKPKTEEFLTFLLWTAELLSRPTFRNLTDSYEAWAYRKGFLRQVGALKENGLLEHKPGTNDRIYRLTEVGRVQALGGRDPAIQWARRWDGRWRLVLFDVPTPQNARREQIRRFLKSKFLGCVQGSVWVSPDPLQEIRETLEGGSINVKSLILFEATPLGGESDAEIAAGAWDFDEINRRYTEHMKILDQLPAAPVRDAAAAKALQRWGAAERAAWLAAVAKDPLLPQALLPADYLGRQAWRKRIQVLGNAGEQLQSFQP